MRTSFYDSNYVGHSVDIKHGFNGVYYVYVDDKFYCSADTYKEVESDVAELIRENSYKTIPEVI